MATIHFYCSAITERSDGPYSPQTVWLIELKPVSVEDRSPYASEGELVLHVYDEAFAGQFAVGDFYAAPFSVSV